MTDDDEITCSECLNFFDFDTGRQIRELFGEGHWHCSACHEVSSYQGHWQMISEGRWGFACQEIW